MIIILTPNRTIAKEALGVNQLLQHGLDLLHIRKYHFTNQEMKTYLSQIQEKFSHKLVLHSHFHLAKEFNIQRLHANERLRQENDSSYFSNEFLWSTSVHSIKDFNALPKMWEYAFLSPVFPSISTPGYGKETTVLSQLSQRKNPNVKLIGLGGITADNLHCVVRSGADGLALLGYVWQAKQPLKKYNQCKNTLQHEIVTNRR